ncbi:MAG: endonuclease III [Actinobacteria bacterium]|nr:endonuclease III [Actinomycetota bacterium]
MSTGIFSPAVKNIDKIIILLEKQYPDALETSLGHRDAFQLLVATILAAQSTDKLVNKVTPGLFRKYKTIHDFADADPEELEQDIRTTGFFRNKTKNIMGAARALVKDFNGEVPGNMEDLISLPGVGRKTANVVLGDCFKKPVIIVDTHMKRISHHIGLTLNTNPDKIEFDLKKIVPDAKQTVFSHKIVAHGRTICIARRPKCIICPILKYCKYGQENA